MVNFVEKFIQGFCKESGQSYFLSNLKAKDAAFELIDKLEKSQSLLFTNEENDTFSLDYLWGNARGQMFGVMLAENLQGERSVHYAFSSQYNGQWLCEGWVPPIFDVKKFDSLVKDADPKIKALTKLINESLCSEERIGLKQLRKAMSQQHMKNIHALYQAHTLDGKVLTLNELSNLSTAPPNGMGDCCAPKLINFAAKNKLEPISIAEFYWGQENASGSKKHLHFYGSCEEKCGPILGRMLYGGKYVSE